MAVRATPEEYEYLMTRGFYDSLGSLRLFEKPLNKKDLDRRDAVKNVLVSKYDGDFNSVWHACASEVKDSMGPGFPDPITAFIDAEIRNWGRT